MTPELKSLTTDPDVKGLLDVNYFRSHQRDEHEREVTAIDRILADPQERKKVHNPGRLKQDNDRRRRNLQAQTPPPLSPSQQDKVARINRLALEHAREGMLTSEEMRHKPAGTTGRLQAWEKAKKASVLVWKRTQLLLNPQSRDRDLCNLERYRPSHPGATNGMIADAGLPAIHALTPAAKQNYDQIDWSSPEVKAEIERQIAAGKLQINTGVRRGALRQQKDGGKVFDCKHAECNGIIFSGPMAAARKARHDKQAHKGEVVAATA